MNFYNFQKLFILDKKINIYLENRNAYLLYTMGHDILGLFSLQKSEVLGLILHTCDISHPAKK